jgi:endonuclease YncB( thermonuclease family)
MRVASMVVALCVAYSLSLEPVRAAPQCPSGRASVVDGDTIEIHGERVRLYGIDAPESAQRCLSGSLPYRCGLRAALALSDMTSRRHIDCECRGRDRYRRHLAVCRVSGLDLAAWLVREGYAVAMRRYSMRYVLEEEAAARKGLWSGSFEMPWDWRSRQGR